MSLANFRSAFLEQLLNFLWRQWTALGVLGESGVEDDWILDPEALLLFSLPIARYEPRLFDAILAWLVANSSRLDASRLRNLLKGRPESAVRCLGAVLQYVIRHSNERKWKSLAALCGDLWKQQPQADATEALFRAKSGDPYPFASVVGAQPDEDFMLFFLDRRKIDHLREGREVSISARANLRFLLRSLFGIGGRSECILYLLTHEGGRPREIAEAAGLFWLGVQQTLRDLSDSGLVLTRQKGKRVEYWISHKRWWDFLAYTGQDIARPKWLNWIAVYVALGAVWQAADELSQGRESDYLAASNLHDSLEVLEREFSRAGYDMPRIPGMGIPPDLYQNSALKFLGDIFKIPAPPPLSPMAGGSPTRQSRFGDGAGKGEGI